MLGQMERLPRMTAAELEGLLAQNRRRVAQARPETAAIAGIHAAQPPSMAEKVAIDEPELL